MSTDHTAREQRIVGRPFQPGVSGNPAGRPRGSKTKLSETFLADLNSAWNEHGQEALRRCAVEMPDTFVKVVASLLPRDISLDIGVSVTAFAASFDAALATLGVEPNAVRRPLPGRKNASLVDAKKVIDVDR